jgi:hypothetical protein
MNLDLTGDEAAALVKELNGLIDGDRYFLSPRIKNLKAIRAKIRPEPVREPPPPPPKCYALPRATARQTRREPWLPVVTTASCVVIALSPLSPSHHEIDLAATACRADQPIEG